MYSPVNLAPRFQAAFGYVPAVPLLLTNERGMPGSQYVPAFGVQVYKSLEENQTFEDMSIYGNGYDLQFAGNLITKSGSLGTVFAPPPIIGYRKAKKLVIGDTNGEEGEVVEVWKNGSWELVIQGIMVDMENHVFPKDKLATMNKVFDVKNVFDISGDWFEALNIESIYFLEFMPVGVQGFMDTISYTLIARSIKPIEFYLNGEEG